MKAINQPVALFFAALVVAILAAGCGVGAGAANSPYHDDAYTSYLPAVRVENPTPNTDQSTRLTDFLKSHRLPLVSAQVLSRAGGGQSVVLYGYTATEVGKRSAEKKTRMFLKDSKVPIVNRIRVRPELALMTSPSGSLPPPQVGTEPPNRYQLGDVQTYRNERSEAAQQEYINQQTQQYMNQQNSPSSLANVLIPLIMLGLAIML